MTLDEALAELAAEMNALHGEHLLHVEEMLRAHGAAEPDIRTELHRIGVEYREWLATTTAEVRAFWHTGGVSHHVH